MKKPKKGVFLVSALAVFLFGAIYWFNTSQFIQRGTLLNEVYANIGDSEEYTLLDTDSQEKLVIILFKDHEMWDEIKSISSDFYEEIYYIKLSDVGSDEYYGDVKKMGTKIFFLRFCQLFITSRMELFLMLLMVFQNTSKKN